LKQSIVCIVGLLLKFISFLSQLQSYRCQQQSEYNPLQFMCNRVQITDDHLWFHSIIRLPTNDVFQRQPAGMMLQILDIMPVKIYMMVASELVLSIVNCKTHKPADHSPRLHSLWSQTNE